MNRRDFLAAAASSAAIGPGCDPGAGVCLDPRGLQLPPQQQAALNHVCNLSTTKEISMSYSHVLKAASKADMLTKLASKMAGSVAAQPIHAADMPRVLIAAEEMLKPLMDPPEGFELQLTIHGSIGTGGVPNYPNGCNQCAVTISGYVSPKIINN
jgi:hypothetical protein